MQPSLLLLSIQNEVLDLWCVDSNGSVVTEMSSTLQPCTFVLTSLHPPQLWHLLYNLKLPCLFSILQLSEYSLCSHPVCSFLPSVGTVTVVLSLRIPLLCFGVVLWILCYQFVKKKREARVNHSLSLPEPPSVYVVPVSEGEEPQLEPDGAHLQPPHRDPPVYSTIHVSLPPPYKVQQRSQPLAELVMKRLLTFLIY